MLAYYTEKFDTVELNNTFYKLPSETGLLNWRDSTPRDFLFAVKGSRFLTHMKKLKDAERGLARFLEPVEKLKSKLGPILFQLPPGWTVDASRLADFLTILPRHHHYAFEFRNPTWDTQEIYDLLGKHNAGYCIFDLAGHASPLTVTANFAYVRLHGPGGKYQGTYTDAALKKWVRQLKAWRKRLKTVYVYFDNDDSGYAPRDALRLKALV